MDCTSTLGAALKATLLVGRSKGRPLAVHGGGTTATILRVVPLPWMPELLRAFALIAAPVWRAEMLWALAPLPATVRCAEVVRAETTVRLEA